MNIIPASAHILLYFMQEIYKIKAQYIDKLNRKVANFSKENYKGNQKTFIKHF